MQRYYAHCDIYMYAIQPLIMLCHFPLTRGVLNQQPAQISQVGLPLSGWQLKATNISRTIRASFDRLCAQNLFQNVRVIKLYTFFCKNKALNIECQLLSFRDNDREDNRTLWKPSKQLTDNTKNSLNLAYRLYHIPPNVLKRQLVSWVICKRYSKFVYSIENINRNI